MTDSSLAAALQSRYVLERELGHGGMATVLAVWGTLFGPFNALGWIAVGFNLMLGVAFGYLAFRRPALSPAAPKP